EGAYIGFTSATGNAYENHDLLAWSFCTKSWKIYSDVEEQSQKTSSLLFGNREIIQSQQTNINFDLNLPLKVEVFDILGNKILTKEYSFAQNFFDDKLIGTEFPQGLCFYKLTQINKTTWVKVLILK
ncbi:hypothetical protein D9V84_11115, partial [Bacteroidetes/Chlorobi group bacterium Naka2016]